MTIKTSKVLIVVLFIYSTCFTFALAYAALSRGLGGGNLVSFALFFPVIYYFVRELAYQARIATSHRDQEGNLVSSFHLLSFLTQKSLLLHLTLLLYLAAAVLLYLRTNQLLPRL